MESLSFRKQLIRIKLSVPKSKLKFRVQAKHRQQYASEPNEHGSRIHAVATVIATKPNDVAVINANDDATAINEPNTNSTEQHGR
jgi:hypothetical protein